MITTSQKARLCGIAQQLKPIIVANPATEGKFSCILRVDYVFIESLADHFFTAYPIALFFEHLGYFFFRITVFVIVENKTDNFCLFSVNNYFLNKFIKFTGDASQE